MELVTGPSRCENTHVSPDRREIADVKDSDESCRKPAPTLEDALELKGQRRGWAVDPSAPSSGEAECHETVEGGADGLGMGKLCEGSWNIYGRRCRRRGRIQERMGDGAAMSKPGIQVAQKFQTIRNADGRPKHIDGDR